MRFLQLSLVIPALLLAALPGCRMSNAQITTEPFVQDSTRQFRKPVRSWVAEQRKNIVMQQADYSCGAAALATVTRYYWGDPTTEEQFLRAILTELTPEELSDRFENGLSMTDLRKAAVKEGYQASIGRIDLPQLRNVTIPLIVRIVVNGFEHFVVVRAIVEDTVFLADPIRGNLKISTADFSEQWTDGVILVVAKPGASPPQNQALRSPESLSLDHPELLSTRQILYGPL